MAFMSQERKKTIAAALKVALKGSGLKYSLKVQHHSALVMTVYSAPLDFPQNVYEVNQQNWGHVPTRSMKQKPTNCGVGSYTCLGNYSGECLKMVQKIWDIMNMGNHDRSDIQTDYFDVGWYADIKFGTYNKPFEVK